MTTSESQSDLLDHPVFLLCVCDLSSGSSRDTRGYITSWRSSIFGLVPHQEGQSGHLRDAWLLLRGCWIVWSFALSVKSSFSLVFWFFTFSWLYLPYFVSLFWIHLYHSLNGVIPMYALVFVFNIKSIASVLQRKSVLSITHWMTSVHNCWYSWNGTQVFTDQELIPNTTESIDGVQRNIETNVTYVIWNTHSKCQGDASRVQSDVCWFAYRAPSPCRAHEIDLVRIRSAPLRLVNLHTVGARAEKTLQRQTLG